MSTTLKLEKPPVDAQLVNLMASGERPPQRTPGQPPSVAELAQRVQRLSVVIPAKNEASGLRALLVDLRTVLESIHGLAFEVLLIDDGSTDETPAVGREMGAIVISHPQSLGNGAAVKRGMREARGDWILMLDGDGQHPPAAIPDLLTAAMKHDMVVASRRRQWRCMAPQHRQSLLQWPGELRHQPSHPGPDQRIPARAC